MTMIENSIDLSRPKRKYLRDEQNLSICPECGSDLIDENCTVLFMPNQTLMRVNL